MPILRKKTTKTNDYRFDLNKYKFDYINRNIDLMACNLVEVFVFLFKFFYT